MAEDEYGRFKSHHNHNNNAKRRKKLIKYIVIFGILIKAVIIGIFILVVVRLKPPKLRLGEIRIQTLEYSKNSTDPKFELGFGAELRIRNPSFFKYEYEPTTVSFLHENVVLGQSAPISAGKLGLRSSKKSPIAAAISGEGSTAATAEIAGGVLWIRAMAEMKGRYEIMIVFGKSKNSEMDCFFVVDLATKMVQRLECD